MYVHVRYSVRAYEQGHANVEAPPRSHNRVTPGVPQVIRTLCSNLVYGSCRKPWREPRSRAADVLRASTANQLSLCARVRAAARRGDLGLWLSHVSAYACGAVCGSRGRVTRTQSGSGSIQSPTTARSPRTNALDPSCHATLHACGEGTPQFDRCKAWQVQHRCSV